MARTKANLDGLRMHDLRHTDASMRLGAVCMTFEPNATSCPAPAGFFTFEDGR